MPIRSRQTGTGFRAESEPIPIRFRSDSDPIPTSPKTGIRFRSDSDPVPTRQKKGIRFRSDFDPIPIRFRSDSDPIPLPSRFRSDSDPIPIRFRSESDPIPIRFRSDSDLVFWSIEVGISTVDRFWGGGPKFEMRIKRAVRLGLVWGLRRPFPSSRVWNEPFDLSPSVLAFLCVRHPIAPATSTPPLHYSQQQPSSTLFGIWFATLQSVRRSPSFFPPRSGSLADICMCYLSAQVCVCVPVRAGRGVLACEVRWVCER